MSSKTFSQSVPGKFLGKEMFSERNWPKWFYHIQSLFNTNVFCLFVFFDSKLIFSKTLKVFLWANVTLHFSCSYGERGTTMVSVCIHFFMRIVPIPDMMLAICNRAFIFRTLRTGVLFWPTCKISFDMFFPRFWRLWTACLLFVW